MRSPVTRLTAHATALAGEPLDPAPPVATLWHMRTLVLTVVGADRAGLVAAVADVVDAHGGNWENSELAELAGAFAGIIEVAVPADRVDELRAALSGLDGLLTISVHASDDSAARTAIVASNRRPPAIAAS